jgi:lipopolysaccharide transport system ATP-binding protein
MSDAVPVLEVCNVSKRFARRLQTSLRYGVIDALRDMCGLATRQGLGHEEFWALNDVSFTVRRGESIGLLGANGAGKSTLLKIIAGLIKPDRGHVTVRGRVGALIELGAGMHPLLSGRENIRVNAAVLGLSQRELASKLDEIIAFADLGEFIDAPVQSYSSGMRVRLGFAVAAHLEPDLLLIDEVLAVGDTTFRMRCFERLRRLRDSGTALIIVSHNSVDLERMCGRAIFIIKGQVAKDGELSQSLSHYESELAIDLATKPLTPAGSPARFTAISIADSTLHTGDSTRITVKIDCTDPNISLRVLMNIISPQLGILGSITSHGHIVLQGARSYAVELRLPRLPLQFGGYALHFWLYGPAISDFFDSSAQHRIRIVGPKTDSFGYASSHAIKFHSDWALL